MNPSRAIVITCEHAGNHVPAAYRHLLIGCGRALRSHHGWDRGALELARCLARALDAPLFHSTVTRLLVDLNRSVGHPTLFRLPLPADAKADLLERHYHPYRRRVEAWIENALADTSRVAHLSIHTFTPVLRGEVRRTDIGLLYDPARVAEKELCRAWRQHLLQARPDLRVRMNYPYLGVSDGFTTHLRRVFGARYLGIELEVSQHWPRNPSAWRQLQGTLRTSLCLTVGAVL